MMITPIELAPEFIYVTTSNALDSLLGPVTPTVAADCPRVLLCVSQGNLDTKAALSLVSTKHPIASRVLQFYVCSYSRITGSWQEITTHNIVIYENEGGWLTCPFLGWQHVLRIHLL